MWKFPFIGSPVAYLSNLSVNPSLHIVIKTAGTYSAIYSTICGTISIQFYSTISNPVELHWYISHSHFEIGIVYISSVHFESLSYKWAVVCVCVCVCILQTVHWIQFERYSRWKGWRNHYILDTSTKTIKTLFFTDNNMLIIPLYLNKIIYRQIPFKCMFSFPISISLFHF